jgi:acetylornithine deacetylase/succinyl-diaminopimelate desuccinylase-like protein
MQKVLAAIDAKRDQFVADLKALMRIPSVSSNPAHAADVRRAAEHLCAHLKSKGLDAKVHDTEGHPLVAAQWLKAPGKSTVLIYGHLDVQPAEPFDEWDSEPFEPIEKDGNVMGRGANDDKGQMMTHVCAVAAWLESEGSLPVNVKMLIEGEEEIGSPSLAKWMRAHRDLVDADVCAISDTAQFGPGLPSICTGLRGVGSLQLHVRTGKGDLHSGQFGGAVPNANQVLAKLLASLHDDFGRVAVEGFYDEVAEPADEEKASWAALPRTDAQFMEEAGVRTTWGEPDRSLNERTWSRPTLEIIGVTGGHQGPGHKGIVPASALARLSIRVVPDMDPARTADCVRRHIEARAPKGVEVRVEGTPHTPATLIPADSKWVQAAKRALAVGFEREPVFIREGGSIPIVNTFQRELNLPCLLLGYGLPDDRIHGPNEKFSLSDFHAGIRTNAALLAELAAL